MSTRVNVLGKAVGAAARDPKGVLRGMSRLPLERAAAARISRVPIVELTELVPAGEHVVQVPPSRSRHGWSLGVAEQLVLQMVIKSREFGSAFEIGTFNGGTTRLIAECLPPHGHVTTLDLPQAAFDATQHPSGFSGQHIGEAYRDSLAAGKVNQIRADSLRFDFSPYAERFDMVLVDGAHDYEHGFSDTQNALRLVRSDGMVFWDDFEPYWHGLVNGICDAIDGRALGRIAGTSLAVFRNSRAEHAPT